MHRRLPRKQNTVSNDVTLHPGSTFKKVYGEKTECITEAGQAGSWGSGEIIHSVEEKNELKQNCHRDETQLRPKKKIK